MTTFYKFLAWLQLVLLLGLGLMVHSSSSVPPKPLGDSLVSTYDTHYIGGIHAGSSDQFNIDASGNQTSTGSQTSGSQTITGTESVTGAITAQSFKTTSIGVSSTTGASLGAGAAGFLALTATTFNATSTILDLNSQVFLTQISTTTNAAFLAVMNGFACTTNIATTTPTVYVNASTTAANYNYLQIKSNNAPVTAPYCYSYRVSN